MRNPADRPPYETGIIYIRIPWELEPGTDVVVSLPLEPWQIKDEVIGGVRYVTCWNPATESV